MDHIQVLQILVQGFQHGEEFSQILFFEQAPFPEKLPDPITLFDRDRFRQDFFVLHLDYLFTHLGCLY